MAVLIGVTPTVHEKFKNYKESSTFRNKTDAELLEYLLDSFEVITCIVELGARTTAAPKGNSSQASSTSSNNRVEPQIASVPESTPEVQEVTPSPVLRVSARKTAPNPTIWYPTVASIDSSNDTIRDRTSNSRSARKSTQSARKSTSKAKKSTSTSPGSCTRNEEQSELPSTINTDLTALEYARNWRASILERSDIISTHKSSSSRRKTTQGTSVPTKPSPLAISPIPTVKTERVDPADIIQQLPPTITGVPTTPIPALPLAPVPPPAPVLDQTRNPNTTYQTETTCPAPEPGNSDSGSVLDQGNINESYDLVSITKTLKLRSKRRKTLTAKAKDLYDFNQLRTTDQYSNLNSSLQNKRKSVAQLLTEAASHTPKTSSHSSNSETNPPQSSNSSTENSSHVRAPEKQAPSSQVHSPHVPITNPSSSDHSYAKRRPPSASDNQGKTKSNKPFILTFKPTRSNSDVASAILSGKTLSPPRSIPTSLLKSSPHATKSTAPKDSSRFHSVAPEGCQKNNSVASNLVECTVCCRRFETKADFERHIKTVSTSKEFDPLSHKRIHPVTTEPPEPDPTTFCRVCRSAFISPYALESHLADGCISQPIRITNVSQISSSSGSSSNLPNGIEAAQKKPTPITPPPVARKRQQSDLFTQTCTMCNQKFCECLISNRKPKSNNQKRPVPDSPKTDTLNFPFPFDLDATRAPDEKENSRHRANNLVPVNGFVTTITPTLARKKFIAKVVPYDSLPKEKDVSCTRSERNSKSVPVRINEIPCSATDNNAAELPSSNKQTESCKLLQQLESVIDTSEQKSKAVVKLKPKNSALSFEETRFNDLLLSPKPSRPNDSTITPEDVLEKSWTATVACEDKSGSTAHHRNTFTIESKTPTLLRERSSEDLVEDIASETDSVQGDIETDDECGISDSEIVEENITNTKSVPGDLAVSKSDDVTVCVKQAPEGLLKDVGQKKGVLSKLDDTGNAPVDSGSELEVDNIITDDELDCDFPEVEQESASNPLKTLNQFEDLLRQHKLFDEAIANAQADECRNLCIVDDDEDDDVVSVSSSQVEDSCFILDSDDECSLSDIDCSNRGSEPKCKEVSSMLLTSHDDELAGPSGYQSCESDRTTVSERVKTRLKSKSLSINIPYSQFSEAPSPRRSKERLVYCGPCNKEFKNVRSLERHESKFHSIF